MPSPVYWISLTICLGCSLFALVKGDRPERYGALLRLGVAALGIPLIRLLREAGVPHSLSSGLTDLITTAMMSFGFLYIALRYASNWLALAMVIQGLEFYIDRVFLDSDVNLASYALQENLITAGVSLVLFFASLSSMDRRHKKRQAEALRSQKAAARAARVEALLSGGAGAAAV
jgi:hypothetical protein